MAGRFGRKPERGPGRRALTGSADRPGRSEQGPRRGSAPGAERGAPHASAQVAARGADREEVGGRYIYGVNPVLETLRAQPDRVEKLWLMDGDMKSSAGAELMARAREAGVKVQRAPRERLLAMAHGGVHQGVIAEVRAFEYAELEDILETARASDRPPLIVVLDGIQDPQNLGAIIRSAHALGAHGVVIPKDRAAGVTPVVEKASAGALAHCPVALVVNLSRALEQLKEEGLWVAAADPDATQDAWDARLDGPLVLVVGSEGPGIREGVLNHCDLRVRFPMAGKVASLNASVSAALLLYEAVRQRSVVGAGKRSP